MKRTYDSDRQRFTARSERARILRVVEELGVLNDRVNACLSVYKNACVKVRTHIFIDDYGGLLAVAAEYAARNVPRRANDVLELVPTGAAVVGAIEAVR